MSNVDDLIKATPTDELLALFWAHEGIGASERTGMSKDETDSLEALMPQITAELRNRVAALTGQFKQAFIDDKAARG